MFGVSWEGLAYSLDSTSWDVELVGWTGTDDFRKLNGIAVSTAGTVYAAGMTAELYTLDPTTGEVLTIDPLPAVDWRGLAWDATNGSLLAVHDTDSVEDTVDQLWRIDPVTHSAALVGDLGLYGVQALEFAPDGTLYGYDIGPSGSGLPPGFGLFVVDPATAVVTDPLPAVGPQQNAQWLTFDTTGKAYTGYEEIYHLDLTTGRETLLGPLGFGGLRGLALLPTRPRHPALCFGDGSAGACPCGNFGFKLTGCGRDNGVGAVLAATGSASVTTDDLRLACVYVTFGQPAVYFQGSNALAGGDGIPFGDGLRCVGTNLIRLEAVVTSTEGNSTTQIPIAIRGGVAAGDTRYYQLWYRMLGSLPCGSGFNTTNAVQVDWMP